ncbi:MAG: type 1 glutamine amidotransferase-like domain-containing protein, partial [Desulfobacteraceae bacterium]|nr:type 1 glutamine amidotransferase-like domain-containing protein [Desulfobacteraceae bacterium]
MNNPKIGIYAGSGTSHSWLWFVDLFEKARFYDLFFLDEISVQNNDIKALDVLIISGGDTFAVAKSLGEKGGRNIKTFVEKGGLYIGSCAGAYLPMKSSKKPLDLFNFVDVKITNLSKTLPIAEQESCKFFTSYGCDFV